jgi:hypothetical protein
MKRLRQIAGGEFIGFSNPTFLSERETAWRNFALAYFMREYKVGEILYEHTNRPHDTVLPRRRGRHETGARLLFSTVFGRSELRITVGYGSDTCQRRLLSDHRRACSVERKLPAHTLADVLMWHVRLLGHVRVQG